VGGRKGLSVEVFIKQRKKRVNEKERGPYGNKLRQFWGRSADFHFLPCRWRARTTASGSVRAARRLKREEGGGRGRGET